MHRPHGRGEEHFTRLEQLRAAARIERESEDWKLRRALDGPDEHDPDPELMEAFEREYREGLEAEEKLLRRLGIED